MDVRIDGFNGNGITDRLGRWRDRDIDADYLAG